MEKTIEESYRVKEQFEERIKDLEKNVMDLKSENVLSKKAISVKKRDLKKLNELRRQDRLEYETQGKAIKMYDQEEKILKDQSSQVLTSDRKFQPLVKEKMIGEFCESFEGQSWFMKLIVPILIEVVTELMDKIHDTNEM